MVGFNDAIAIGLQKYFDFTGRSTRAEYWWFACFILLGTILLSIFDISRGTYSVATGSGLLSGVFRLLTLIPSLAVGARRLHDINKSGWWQLLWVVLFFGWIVLIVWACKRSDVGVNKYG